MPVAHLPDRAVISIKGEDAVSFLAGLLTCAVDAGPTPRYGALLTPQGKIIADFFLCPAQTAGCLEGTARTASSSMWRSSRRRIC